MRFLRSMRQHRAVLDALAAAGDAGMTPLSLAVTTDLPEDRVAVIVRDLVHTGTVRTADGGRWSPGVGGGHTVPYRLCPPAR